MGNKNVTRFPLNAADIFHPSLTPLLTFQCEFMPDATVLQFSSPSDPP